MFARDHQAQAMPNKAPDQGVEKEPTSAQSSNRSSEGNTDTAERPMPEVFIPSGEVDLSKALESSHMDSETSREQSQLEPKTQAISQDFFHERRATVSSSKTF